MTHKLTRMIALVLAVVMAFSVLLVPASAASFNDVSGNAWYKAAVDYVQERGWMTGVSETSFAPNKEVTRGMMVTVLARVAGAETDNETAAFTDTASGKWYTGAAAWAAENGIVAGVGNGLFAPNRAITRQDLCVMLYKYISLKGYELKNDVDRSFSDMESVLAYAREAVLYCAGVGLVSGFEDGSFRPKDTATRAQIAQMMMRLDLLVKGEEVPAEPMPAQSFEGEAGEDMAVSVNAPEGALPENTKMTVRRVTDEAALAAIQAKLNGQLYAAADITFTKDSAELEPAAEVEVQISLDGLENLNKPSVVHIKDDGSVEYVSTQLVNFNRGSGKALRFFAKDFSVYAVFDGNDDMDARLTVQFWKPIFNANGTYTLQKGYSVYVTRRDVDNQDGENGEAVNYIPNLIVDQPIEGITGSQVFFGWSLNEDFTEAEADGRHTIEYIRDEVYNFLSEKENGNYVNGIVDGTTVLNVYPIIFNFYTVTYMDELGDSAITVKGYYSKTIETTVEVGPGSAYTPYDAEETHVGWIRMGDNQKFVDGEQMTISSNTVLRARVAKGVWLYFEENPGEHYKGATYVPPIFCEEGIIPQNAKPDDNSMKLAGYTFGGWYTEFTAGANQPADHWSGEFGFNGTIRRDTTIYAKWTADPTASYTVIVWKQKVSDSKDAADAEKKYDFVFSKTLTANSFTAVNTSSLPISEFAGLSGNPSYTLDSNQYNFLGFKFNTTKGISSTDSQIQPNASTVINFYYDRELVTMTFYPPTYSRQSAGSSKPTSFYSTWDKYVLVDGYYHLINSYQNNSSTGYVTYVLYDTYLAEMDESKTYYWINNSTLYYVYYVSGSGWRYNTTASGTGTAFDFSTNDPQVRLSAPDYVYTVSFPANNSYTFTGLYGQSLVQNGYTWPSDYWWYQSLSDAGNPNGTRTTFLDTFNLAGSQMSETFYGSKKSGVAEIKFYKQTLGKTDLEAAGSYTLANTVGTEGNGFNLSDKYDGFTCYSYRINDTNGQFTTVGELMHPSSTSSAYYYDADPNTDGYQSVPRNLGLHIRFARNKYIISYNYGKFVDGWENEIISSYTGQHIKDTEPIYYEELLNDYAEGRTKWYDPVAEGDFKDDLYVFVGWYTSPNCANGTEFTFRNETMPLGGLTLYAKFVLKQYRVFLDLNESAYPGLEAVLPATQEQNFRMNYQALISNGEKINVVDGNNQYELIGWYVKTVENGQEKLSVFNFKSQLTDVFASEYTDKLPEDANRNWIDKKIDLVAMWRRVLDGANGIHVFYDPDYIPEEDAYHGHFDDDDSEPFETEPIEDSQVYIDGAEVIARPGSLPFANNYQFLYWEILDKDGHGTGQYVYPGQKFNLDVDDAAVEEGGIHDHAQHLTHVDAVAPTCTESGLAEHWRCTLCGKLFSDTNATNAVTLANLTLQPLGHDWGEASYDWASDHLHCTGTVVCGRDSSHVVTETVAATRVVTPATPTTDGVITYTAVFENTEHFSTQVFTETLEYSAYTVNFIGPAGYENTMPAPISCEPNSTITLPTPSSCPEGYTFVGWVAPNVTVSDSTTMPTIFIGSYTVSTNSTLKALYAYEAGGGAASFELVTAAPSDWAGRYVITYGTDTDMKLLKGVTPSSNGESIENSNNFSTYANAGVTLNGTRLTGVADDYVFTMTAHGSYWSVQNVAKGSYLGETSSGALAAYTIYTATYCDWTPGTGANASGLTSAYTSSYPNLTYSSYFWTLGSVSTNIRFWKENQSTTTHYTTELTAYSVTYSVPQGVTIPAASSVKPGMSVTLPAANAPSGATFLGWVEDPVEQTEQSQSFLAAGAQTDPIYGNKTFYAYYRYNVTEAETVYDLVTATPASWEGNYVVTYLKTTSLYALKGIAGASGGQSYESSSAGGASSYANSGMTLENNRLHNVEPQFVFNIASRGSSGYSMQNAALGSFVGRYVTTEAESAKLMCFTAYNSDFCNWTLEYVSAGNVRFFNAPSAFDGSYPYLGFNANSSYFWVNGTGTNYTTNAYLNMYLWKETTANVTTTYYSTDPAGSGPHTHTITHVAAAAPTCGDKGNVEYWYCTECGAYFIDEGLTTQVPRASTEIAATGEHIGNGVWNAYAEGHSQTCTVCGKSCNGGIHTENEGVVTLEPTATTPGTRTYSCSVCGYVMREETIPPTGNNTVEVVDTLTNSNTYNGTNTAYKAWTASGSSGAAYSGQSGGQYTTIQLRQRNSNSGIVTTTSPGVAKKVAVVFNTNTDGTNAIAIYGKNTAYSSPADLYNTSTQGTKIGTIARNASVLELEIPDGFAYIGIRTNGNYTVWLNSVSITWEVPDDGNAVTEPKQPQSTVGLNESAVHAIGSDLAETPDAISNPNPVTAANLSEALNVAGGALTFSFTNSTYPWIVEGEHAKSSGYATNKHNISSGVETTIANMAVGDKLLFQWKVSSESGYDELSFYVDGTLQTGDNAAISGTTMNNFVIRTYTVTAAGNHTFRWVYSKDGSNYGGSDCGYLDNVEYISNAVETGLTKVSTPQAGHTYVIVPDSENFALTGTFHGRTDPSQSTSWLNAVAVTKSGNTLTVPASSLPGITWVCSVVDANSGIYTWQNVGNGKYLSITDPANGYLNVSDTPLSWKYTSERYFDNMVETSSYYYVGFVSTHENVLVNDFTVVKSGSALALSLYEYVAPSSEYTVRFVDYDGSAFSGSAFDDQTVDSGDPVVEPSQTPTRAGYTFKCWRVGSETGSRWHFEYPVTQELTLYACYEKNASGAEELWVPYTSGVIDTSKDYLIGVEYDGHVYLVAASNPGGYTGYYYMYYQDSTGTYPYYYYFGYQGNAELSGENVVGIDDANTPDNLEYYVWNFSSTSGGTITSKLNSSVALNLWGEGSASDGAYYRYWLPYPSGSLTPSSDWVWSYANHTLKTGSFYLSTGTMTYTDGPVIKMNYGNESNPNLTIRLYQKADNFDVTYMAGNQNLGTDHVTGSTTLRTEAIEVSGYDFIGWLPSTLAETSTAPEYYAPGAAYTGSGNVTMHALYRRIVSTQTEQTVYKLLTAAPADWSGDYVITSGTSTSNYAMVGLAESGVSYETSSNGGQKQISTIDGVTLSDNTLYNVPDLYVFTLSGSGNTQSICNKSTGTYVVVSNSYIKSGSSPMNWAMSFSSPNTIAYDSNSNYYLRWYSGHFYAGSTNGTSPYFWRADTESVHEATHYYTTEVVTQNWTITFDANGGTGEMVDQVAPDGIPVNLNASSFSRFGYDFAGWTENRDGSGAFYADRAQITLSADKTLYAKWTPKTYTVTFDANGGTGEMAPQTFEYGVAQALAANGFTAPEGKAFAGWNTAANGSEIGYGNQEIVYIESSTILYAQWDDPQIWYPTAKVIPGEEYLIGYEDGSGSVYLLMNYNPNKLSSAATGDNANQNENYYYATADNVKYSYGILAARDGENVIGIGAAPYADATLANTVWVFERNGDYLRIRSGANDGRYLRVSQNVLRSSDLIPSGDHPEYAGNWTWNSENGSLGYVAGAITRNVTYAPSVDGNSNFFYAPIGGTRGVSNLKLYSRTAATFIVTFVDSFTGEDVVIGEPQEVAVHSGAIAPAAPAHVGYVFEGWIDGNGDPIDYSDVTSNLTVYAKYTAHAPFTVSFKSTDNTDVLDVDGNVIPSQTVNASDVAHEPAKAPQCEEGFIFKEWQLNGVRFDFSEPIVDDIVLTPAFTRLETTAYTITLRAVYGPMREFTTTHVTWYADNDANAYQDSEEVILNNRIPILDPTTLEEFYNPGFKFLGWARLSENEEQDGYTAKAFDENGNVIHYQDLDEGDLWLAYHTEGDAPYFTVKSNGVDRVVTHIAANENKPYHGLYAVWAPRSTFYVFHSSTGVLEAFEIPQADAENGHMKNTFDLTDLVEDGYLYGGYYKTYGGVVTDELAKVITNGEGINFQISGGWSAASEYTVNGTTLTKHTYDTKNTGNINVRFRAYTGESLTNGDERFWTKAKAYNTAKGDEAGNLLHAKAGEIYYLKEVPETYLTTKYLYTYNTMSDPLNEITNFFMLTLTDDTYYSNVGFRVGVGENATLEGTRNGEFYKRDALVAVFNLVQNNADGNGNPATITVDAASFGKERGYVGMKNLDSLITPSGVFTIMPVWYTYDGVEVQSRGAIKLTVNSNKTAISFEYLGDNPIIPSSKLYIDTSNPVLDYNTDPWTKWDTADAVTKLYVYGDSGTVWVTASKVEDGLWVADLPAGKWSTVIIVRCNPEYTGTDYWSGYHKWAQTVDIPLDRSKNLLTIENRHGEIGDDYGKYYCQYGTYTPSSETNP